MEVREGERYGERDKRRRTDGKQLRLIPPLGGGRGTIILRCLENKLSSIKDRGRTDSVNILANPITLVLIFDRRQDPNPFACIKSTSKACYSKLKVITNGETDELDRLHYADL